jgi:TonB-dependent siderophore receptor
MTPRDALPGTTYFALALLLIALPLALSSQASALPAGQETEAAAQEEPAQSEQELPLRASEIVFVEGSLPFVPTSNTIATKLPLSLMRTPQNVGIVARGLFEEQYGRVAGDALANVSNVNVQPGFGVTDYFVVRGFDSLSSSLILTDGAPEPETTFYQLYNVEAVEVLKGPGGFLYGSNPLAGAVNLVRKQALPRRGLGLGVAYGGFGTAEGTFDGNLGRPGGEVFGRLNGLYRRADSWRDNKGSEVFAINPAVTWQIANEHRLTGNFEYLRSDFSPDAGIPLFLGEIAEVAPGNDYNTSLDRSEQDLYRFQLDYEGRLSDSVTLRNKFYTRNLDWISDGTLIIGAFPDFGPTGPTGTASVFRTMILLDDRQSVLGNQLEAVLSFATGSVQHEMLAGFEITRHSDEYTLDIGLVGPVDLAAPQDNTQGALVFPESAGNPRSVVFAPYLIDQISFSDHFQVLAGARFDTIDFEDELNARDRSDSEVSPMVGAVWLPNETVSVYGNWSRSFAPPSPRVLESLEPERSEQLEFGVKLALLDGRARATASVYHLERENIAIPDDNGFTQQAGNQRSRGFEVDFAAELGGRVHGVASYAYNDAELTRFAEQVLVPGPAGFVPIVIDHSGNRPAFAPEHLFSTWFSKTFRSGLGVGLGARFMAEQFISEDNSFVLPSAFVLNGQVSYAIDGYRLSLNVENVTDRSYYLRGFGSQSVTPAAPIAVYARLSVDF